jgi:DNA-binding GntR family transcriptional regulator
MATPVVRPQTLSAATQDAIRAAIFSGELRPGQPLREVELSSTLQVSRGTMREALRALEEEGLVKVIPHRGAFVVQLAPRTAQEVYAVRLRLEPYAVRVAMENHAYTEADFAALEQRVRQMGESTAAGRPAETIQLDREFHYHMCRPSDIHVLLRVLENLRSLTTLCMHYIKIYDPDSTPDEPSHKLILDALRSGDPEIGEAAAKKHLEDFGTRLVNQMTAFASGR